jgi:RNA polymerase sigma-70 factor (ECF subfamily)
MNIMVIDLEAVLLGGAYDLESLAESLIDQYYCKLHLLAYSILGDADEADDATQEALIRAIGRIDSYRPGSNLKSWLSSIVVNQCRDMIRRRKVRQKLANGLQTLMGGNRPVKSPELKTSRSEAKAALWLAVDQLDEKHRLPIILRYANNLSGQEIGQILRLREGTVYSRLHHACHKLGVYLLLDDREDLVEVIINE